MSSGENFLGQVPGWKRIFPGEVQPPSSSLGSLTYIYIFLRSPIHLSCSGNFDSALTRILLRETTPFVFRREEHSSRNISLVEGFGLTRLRLNSCIVRFSEDFVPLNSTPLPSPPSTLFCTIQTWTYFVVLCRSIWRFTFLVKPSSSLILLHVGLYLTVRTINETPNRFPFTSSFYLLSSTREKRVVLKALDRLLDFESFLRKFRHGHRVDAESRTVCSVNENTILGINRRDPSNLTQTHTHTRTRTLCRWKLWDEAPS